MKKKTTTKKKSARPIPPPPPGWEIVGKDDPRLKKLPCRPMTFDPYFPGCNWSNSGYDVGDCVSSAFRKTQRYALPIATQSAAPQSAPPSPPMIRLRLPSEKPTREDADEEGNIFTIYQLRDNKAVGVTNWIWNHPFDGDELAWFSLPDGILPREPSQEEKWRAEFEAMFNKAYDMAKINGEFIRPHTFAAWEGFLAAKKGGAK
jgi:hypothetical protein